jgi:hypothetical protein
MRLSYQPSAYTRSSHPFPNGCISRIIRYTALLLNIVNNLHTLNVRLKATLFWGVFKKILALEIHGIYSKQRYFQRFRGVKVLACLPVAFKRTLFLDR